MAVAFCVTVNGRWLHYSQAPALYGSFNYRDPVQPLLLPYFTVGDVEIDPYDGAKFEGDQLDELIKKLNQAIAEFKSKDPYWPLSGDPEWIAAFGNCEDTQWARWQRELPRDESIGIFERAIELALQARKTNEKLQFLGD